MKKKKVSSKSFLYFTLMEVYQKKFDSSVHEFLLAKLKFVVCLIQYKSSRVLNEYKKNRSVNIIIVKIMIMIILMIMIIIIVIIIAVIIIIIIMTSPFQPRDFSTGSTTATIYHMVLSRVITATIFFLQC